MVRTCRWTPTPGSRPRSPEAVGPRDSPATVAGGAGDRLRRQRRAPGISPERSRSAPLRCSSCWSSTAARPATGPPAWSSSTATAATSMRCAAPSPCSVRRPRRRVVRLQRRRCRRPRRAHRNVCIATYFARTSYAPRSGSPGNEAPLAELMPRLRAAASPRSARSACSATPRRRSARRGVAYLC